VHVQKYLRFIFSGLRPMGQHEGYYLFFHTLRCFNCCYDMFHII
jgi:hypothetical protein